MNLIILRLLQLHLLLWPTIWGLAYIGFDLWVDNVNVYWFGYASAWITAILLFLGAQTRDRSIPVEIRLARWQWSAVGLTAIAALLAPILSAPVPWFSYLKMLMYLPCAGAGFAAAYWLPTLPRREWRSIIIALGLGMILFVLAVFPLLPGYFEAHETWWDESIAPFFHIRRFTHVVIIAIASGTGFWVWSRTLETRMSPAIGMLMIISMLSFGWAILFWAGSRGPIVAFSGTVTVIATMIPTYRRALLEGWVIPIAAGAAISSQLHFLGWDGSMFGRLSELDTDTGLNQLTTGRIEIWKITLEQIREAPLFGYGFGQFGFVSPIKIETPHNFFLEMLHSFGIVGGLPMIALVFGSAFMLFRKLCATKGDPMALAGGFVVCTMTIQSLVDGVLSGFYLAALFGFFWAMAWAVLNYPTTEMGTLDHDN